MSSQRTPPVVRVAALLVSTAVVGGLIGFTWEHASYEATTSSDDVSEQLPGADTFERPGKPQRSNEEEATLQRALSHFPPYPRASRPEALAVDYLGPNVPIAVAWLTTKDAPDQVLEHYRQVLKEKGLPVISQRYSAHAGFVGYWDPGSGEVFLVSVLAQGGETLLFVSSGSMAPLLEGNGPVPGWLPLPPEVEQRTFLSMALEGATQHTLSGIIPMRPLEEVADAYQALLASHGWSIAAIHSDGSEREFEVRRGQIQGTALLRREAAGPGIHLFLSLLERR